MRITRRSLILLSTALVVLFTSVFLFGGTVHAQEMVNAPVINPLRQNEPIIEQQTQLVVQKSTELNNTSQEIQDLVNKKQTLAQKLENETKLVEELRQKIADKKAAEERAKIQAAKPVLQVVAQFSAPAVYGDGPRSGCGDNQYAAYIYGMESGGRVVGNCNPSSRNGGGCMGIGQACPGSKLLAVCPSLDYACENIFFTGYANSRYGGWAGAYAAWQSQGWW